MGKKSENRQRRRAKRIAKFEAGKTDLIERVTLDSEPKVQADVQNIKIPHLAPHLEREQAKQPKAKEIGSRFSEQVTWCDNRSDTHGGWSWGEARAWEKHEWQGEIEPKLMEYSKLTWAEVDSFSSESGHKMHHGHDIDHLVGEAQERWFELNLDEFANDIFRFRLEGTKRAWGYIVQAHFYLVWWERYHKIYPVD